MNRRKRKPKKKAKPFTITRRPPVDADFIPEETNHEGEKVVTEVNNGRIWTELLLAVQGEIYALNSLIGLVAWKHFLLIVAQR